jgi:hypothetical protein
MIEFRPPYGMFYDMEGKMHVPMDDGIGDNVTEQQEENLSDKR